MNCLGCGRANANAASFCQFCGRSLVPKQALAAQQAGFLKSAPKTLPPLLCLDCGVENPGETNFCFECGSRLRSPSSAVPPPSGPRRARLVAVRRDGSDGASYPFERSQLDIGRSEGDLRFDDPHLAARHARLIRESNGFLLVPLEPRNGVYLQISSPTMLSNGDYVLVGKQVLMFEEIPALERTLAPGIEQGVVLFGTPTRPPWGRLRQMTAAGTARDIYHLTRSETVLGREQGDVVFSDDEFMSRRHASIRGKAGSVELEDLGSSNGTFIRLRTQHALSGGEMLRLGDELLRFELL